MLIIGKPLSNNLTSLKPLLRHLLMVGHYLYRNTFSGGRKESA